MTGLTDPEWRAHRERRGYVDPKPGYLAWQLLEQMRKRFNRALGSPFHLPVHPGPKQYRVPSAFARGGTASSPATILLRPGRVTSKPKEKPCCLLWPHEPKTQAEPTKTQVTTPDDYNRQRVQANVFNRLEVGTGEFRCASHSMGGQRCIKEAGHEGWHKGRILQKDHTVNATFWGVDP